VARLLRDQATGDGYHCTRWSKTYSGCGWARAFQSRMGSTGGSSHAGGWAAMEQRTPKPSLVWAGTQAEQDCAAPGRAGLIRGGSAGSPMWFGIRCTGALERPRWWRRRCAPRYRSGGRDDGQCHQLIAPVAWPRRSAGSFLLPVTQDEPETGVCW